MTESTKPESATSFLSGLPRSLFIVGSIAAVGFLLFVAYELWQFLSNFNQTADILAEKYGINQWLSKAAALLVTGPLAWGVKQGFFAPFATKHRKDVIRIGTGLYACLYLVGMWAVDRNVYFDHQTGKALKYWSMDQGGQIQLYDSPGFDTRTQQALQEATSDIMHAYEQQQAGESPRPVSIDDFLRDGGFDRNTGMPRVWFARRADGGFALYDRRGFDSATRSQLKGMTPDAAEEVQRWIEAEANAKQDLVDQDVRAVAERANEDKRAKAAADRSAYIDRYIDRRAGTVSGAANVAVRLMGSQDADSASLASAVNRALRDRGFNVVPLFKPAFAQEGLDRELFQGSPSLAQRLDLAKHCDSVLLGVVRMASPPRNASGLFLTEMVLDIREISSATGSVTDQIEIREKGGALDAQASVIAALDKLAGSVESRLADWPQS